VAELHHDLGRPTFDSCAAALQAAGYSFELLPPDALRPLLVAHRRA